MANAILVADHIDDSSAPFIPCVTEMGSFLVGCRVPAI
jgi:hypothetical protein